MNNDKLVSVLICTNNAERFIRSTIDSIIWQTYSNLEVLIHDDASTDDTVHFLNGIKEELPFPCEVFVANHKKGPYSGLNFLLGKAKGHYIAILDHDDLWCRDKIARQVTFLENHQEFQGCGTMTYVLWEAINKISVFRATKLDDKAFHSTLVFRNNDEFRYDESYLYRNDFHFIRKYLCRENGAIYNIQEALAVWRIRADGQNLSSCWGSFRSIWSYIMATRDYPGGIYGYFFNLLPRKLIDRILMFRFAIETEEYSPEKLEALLSSSESNGLPSAPPPCGHEV